MSEFIGTASVLIRPDTTAFRAQLVAELAAATRGIVVPLPVVAGVKGAAATTVDTQRLTGALRAQGAVLLDTTAAETELAGARQRSGAAAVRNTVAAREEAAANRTAAKAAAESAASHELLARGAGASVLSLLGIRGATLAASAPFLAGAAAVTILAKSVKEASAEQEALARVERILGPAVAATSEEWAKEQAAVGVSTAQALKAEGALAEVFHNLGFGRAAVESLSKQFAELAPDLAQFANVPVEDLFRAIQLGVSGNLRSLRPFIGALRQADITNRALADSGKATASELTSQELAVARLQLILEKSANQVDQFRQRQGEAAGQAKILKANLADLGGTIGSGVLPPLVKVTKALNDFFDSAKQKPDESFFQEFVRQAKEVNDWTTRIAQHVIFGPAFHRDNKEAAVDLRDVATTAAELNRALGISGVVDTDAASFASLTAKTFDFVAASEKANAALRALTGSIILERVETNNLARAFSAGISGLSDAQQIANDERIIETARQVLGRKGGKETAAQRKEDVQKALAAGVQAEQDIKSIRDRQAADAKAAAAKAQSDAEKAANEAQKRLDDADQKLLATFDREQGSLNLHKTLRAKRTKDLKDDIAADVALDRLLTSEITRAGAIHDAELRKRTILDLRTQREQERQDRIDLIRQRHQDEREHRVKVSENRLASAQLDIDLAETIRGTLTEGSSAFAKNTQRLIALHRERIKFFQKDELLHKGDTLAIKRDRNAIAEENAAIDELKKTTDDRNKKFQALTFSFLQAQQGFAANLLSNLLPVGAIRGTVGGAGGMTGGAASVAGSPAAFFDAGTKSAGTFTRSLYGVKSAADKVKHLFVLPPPHPGLLHPGNIDLLQRLKVHVPNPKGGFSSVFSASAGVNVDGKQEQLLFPTVVLKNGKWQIVSVKEALAIALKTHKNLGLFDTPAHATAYAKRIHEEQAAGSPSALGPGMALASAGAVAGAGGGATRTQMAALIDINRAILGALVGAARGSVTPEATMQMMWQGTAMAHL